MEVTNTVKGFEERECIAVGVESGSSQSANTTLVHLIFIFCVYV